LKVDGDAYTKSQADAEGDGPSSSNSESSDHGAAQSLGSMVGLAFGGLVTIEGESDHHG
jgi:hypothetical protein